MRLRPQLRSPGTNSVHELRAKVLEQLRLKKVNLRSAPARSTHHAGTTNPPGMLRELLRHPLCQAYGNEDSVEDSDLTWTP